VSRNPLPSNNRIAVLPKRWDRLRSGLDLILDQLGADMADIPGGASGIQRRDYKGKEADRLVTRITPAWSRWSPNSAATSAKRAEELEQWRTHHEERKVIDASQAAITCRKPSTACAPW
jgi:hypothetical protein